MIPVRQTKFSEIDPQGRENSISACLASILEIPLNKTIDITSDACNADWFGSSRRWLADRGLKIIQVAEGYERLNGSYSIAHGTTPIDARTHSIVCKSGRLVFDPHPSDDGLRQIFWHDILVELSEAEMVLHARGLWHPRRAERVAA